MKRIEVIVERINELAERGTLATFPVKRAEAKSLKVVTRREFLASVHNREGADFSGYAFHWGGRSELQFNVGFEEDRYFRYGVAFSFEPSQALRDPVGTLRPSVDAFNRLANTLPWRKTKLRMWRFLNHQRRDERAFGEIPLEWVRTPDFVFMGERVRVGPKGLTSAQLQRAMSVLEQLLPLYQAVELERAPTDSVVARVCWNTNMWQRPSGRAGKSQAKGTFESVHGYGHEEWLLNTSMLVDGWKYGFIQALNRSQKRLQGQTMNLLLYTIEFREKSRFWIAKIRNAEVLSESDARHARRIMAERRYLATMKGQVRALGLDPSELATPYPLGIVNVRFKPESLELIDPPLQFPARELRSSRYSVLQGVPSGQAQVWGGINDLPALRQLNQTKLKAKRRAYVAAGEVDLLHKRWQVELSKSLPRLLPNASIAIEVPLAGHHVDLVVRRGQRTIYFELKTDSVVRQAIRSAVGQLLEYAYWPPGQPRADALVVVGSGKAGPEDIEFLKHLRSELKIPIHYLRYTDGAIEALTETLDEIAPMKESGRK